MWQAVCADTSLVSYTSWCYWFAVFVVCKEVSAFASHAAEVVVRFAMGDVAVVSVFSEWQETLVTAMI